VAARLNYLHQDGLVADQIQVRWDSAQGTHVIYVKDPSAPGDSAPAQAGNSPDDRSQAPGGLAQLAAHALGDNSLDLQPSDPESTQKAAEEPLLVLDARTISPDSQGDARQDALQVTNRLRRLMGNAEPLRTIDNDRQGLGDMLDQAAVRQVLQGLASWYGPGFHGQRSANGEMYNQNALTAAHRSLPFNTQVRVTNLDNGRSVVVRINDRGPYGGGRIIDLSQGAAQQLGMIQSGVARVRLDVLQ